MPVPRLEEKQFQCLEIYQKIKTLLSEPNPNKAAIAREVGVSVVQVRKVAVGGYEKKFGASTHLFLK